MIERDAPETDPLYLALTRPPMTHGITYTFLMMAMMVGTTSVIAAGPLYGFAVFFALYLLGYLACQNDPLMFDIWVVKLVRCPPVMNTTYWKANSYARD